jgi:hypothetical protein
MRLLFCKYFNWHRKPPIVYIPSMNPKQLMSGICPCCKKPVEKSWNALIWRLYKKELEYKE